MWRARTVVPGLLGLGLVGAYSVDKTINDDWDAVKDQFRTRLTIEEQKKNPRPKVVIVGTGWGALNILRKLHCDKYEVTVVSPRNYFLFTPLLAGATVGDTATRSIIEPIRNYCHRSDAEEVRFVQAECTSIDSKTKRIQCRDKSDVKGAVEEFSLEYDELIVACGARVNTFGIKGVQENAIFMKEINDATRIRNRIIDCFETASIPGQPADEIKRLLHFAVVGGGPSGVEFAAALHDLLADDMSIAYPDLAPHVTVTLVEAMAGILRSFDPGLVQWTEGALKRENIDLWLNTFVSGVGPREFTVKVPVDEALQKHDKDTAVAAPGPKQKIQRIEKSIPYGMLVWVAGIGTRPLVSDLAQKIGKEAGQDERRGLKINDHMQVVGCPHVWAIGDCAVSGLPPTAQVASQQGAYLGRLFNRLSDDLMACKHGDSAAGTTEGYESIAQTCDAFVHQYKGQFAYVGNHEAVCQVATWSDDVHASGHTAYALWASVYWSKLLSLPNRTCVAFDWFKTKVFGRDISRR